MNEPEFDLVRLLHDFWPSLSKIVPWEERDHDLPLIHTLEKRACAFGARRFRNFIRKPGTVKRRTGVEIERQLSKQVSVCLSTDERQMYKNESLKKSIHSIAVLTAAAASSAWATTAQRAATAAAAAPRLRRLPPSRRRRHLRRGRRAPSPRRGRAR